MKAVRVHQFGGADALRIEEISEPSLSAGQALISLRSIGLNYIDIYFRTGLYEAPLPFTPGLEGAGIVEAAGAGVKDVKIGDRIAYAGILGSYAQKAVVPAERLVKLPDQLSFQQGAAAMVQGITAQYLTTSAFPLKKGKACLIHAAAGGVGLLLCQAAKLKGATVIGTVSTEEKAELARQAGADHVILYTQKDFVAELKRITGNRGVDVVYDGVGQATFMKGLDCLVPRGTMVLFGQAGGPVPPFDLNILNKKGSLYVTRPGINAYIATREEFLERAKQVFSWIMSGQLNIRISREFSLDEVREAHELLESRRTTGKILLYP